MIIDYIQKTANEARQRGENPLYIRSLIKEYFQILVLYFIYTNNDYKSNLIFTGGTCLRHFYGLERLSEDLDFDFTNSFEPTKLAKELNDFFEKELKFKGLNISIKQQGKQILLKFPVLKSVGLANADESVYLYIKCDVEQVRSSSFKTIKSTKSAYGYNFVALHYDLPSLFAGKIVAILTRNLFIGKTNRETIKGRDFYDLLWYLKKGTKVNIKLVQEKLDEKNLSIEDLRKRIESKVTEATTRYKNDFKNDLLPFISDTKFLDDYVDNYAEEFARYGLEEQVNR